MRNLNVATAQLAANTLQSQDIISQMLQQSDVNNELRKDAILVAMALPVAAPSADAPLADAPLLAPLTTRTPAVAHNRKAAKAAMPLKENKPRPSPWALRRAL
jgi:hypothetical protein